MNGHDAADHQRGRTVRRDRHAMGDFDVHQAFVEHGRALYGFALNTMKDAPIAEDCVQETFVRAWRARATFDPGLASERTWLFAIARNVIIDEMRGRSRRPLPIPEERMESAAPPVTVFGAAEDQIVLTSGLARLSEEHRNVIVAISLDGLTYQELAERTGVPAPTLRTRMYYGLRALRKAIGEEEEEQ
ncbi:RNA polymerase sigma factor [Pseudarthrobacter sp. PS3-L1]|uniref:RNA polymerase sigma factor n=1 Tax=Pseudarthrobacter sp. PS3-L1 TaxID=3046207 RepID=UPI0024BB979F|nr:RNA polymerase sigma factor [Pseudarthrobacter sp. PS3-L1]MDJ0320830.1 RNA polymerase sigma factor [Pseudarthrobacter sp. PS3-L1]